MDQEVQNITSNNMKPSRRELHEQLQGIRFAARSDFITDYLFNRLGVPVDADVGLKVSVRRCASRFVSAHEERRKKCFRKGLAFETKFKDWLDVVPSYPDVPYLNAISSDQVVPVSSGDLTEFELDSSAPEVSNALRNQVDNHPRMVIAEVSEKLCGCDERLLVPDIALNDQLVRSSSVDCNDNLLKDQLEMMPKNQLLMTSGFDWNIDLPQDELLEVTPVDPHDLTFGECSSAASTSSGKRGRPSTPFEDCSERTKLRKTESLRCQTDPAQVFYSAEKILSSQGYHSAARSVRKIFNDPAAFEAKTENKEETWSSSEALGVFVEMGCSRRNWQALRNAAVKRNSVLITPYSGVLQAKNHCYPYGMVFSESGAEVPLQHLLDHTVNRILLIETVSCHHLHQEQLGNLELLVKYGMDGSSGHSNYRQEFKDGSGQVGGDSNAFICSMVPLQIHVPGENIVLWKNPFPNSQDFCRMISFKFVKESANIITDTARHISDQIKELKPTNASCSGRQLVVHHRPLFTMVDVKVINTLTNTGSSTCYICQALPSEMNDLESVSNRPIIREHLMYGAASLHAKMRVTDLLIKVASKQDVQEFRVTDAIAKEVVMARHNIIQQDFMKHMNLLVDFPLPGGCGNTNNGNTARKSLGNPSLSASLLGIDEELLRQLDLLTGMLASSQFVDPDEYDVLAKKAATRYIELYSWYPMSPTLHKVLIHGADIIRNFPVPVGWLSEEAQETANKTHRNGRLNHAFKGCRTRTNEDVLKRNMVTSDPFNSMQRALLRKKSSSSSDTG